MATSEFASMTVVELRKAAKEYGIKLGAGLSKADIVEKLESCVSPLQPGDLKSEQDAEPEARIVGRVEEEPAPGARIVGRVTDAPAAKIVGRAADTPAPTASKKPEPGSMGQFHAAWHNPTARYGTKPAYQAPVTGQMPRVPASADQTRLGGTVKPAGYKPRFGPAAQSTPTPVQEQRTETVRPAYLRQSQEQEAKSEAVPKPETIVATESPKSDTLPDLLNPVSDCIDFEGVLEFNTENCANSFGWLRADSLVQSSKDVHIDIQQVRRFGLRPGDRVTGKAQHQRNKEYPAFLYPETVNGVDAEKINGRPRFEEMTAVYPSRHIPMDGNTSLRMADLAAPIGFGSRCLVMVPPEADKLKLFRLYAEAIAKCDPGAEIMILLIDENPEDVTLLRDQVECPVYAATFDQQAEQQFRLVDLVLEHAKRIAELKQNAVILVDSLTRLAKISGAGSPQGGRTATGTANPIGIAKAKRLLGAAHGVRDGGSLTVIGTINTDNNSRMDEAIAEEFRDTANSELYLDAALLRAGIQPGINVLGSGTRRAELFLTEAQVQAIRMLKTSMTSETPANVVNQIMSMIEKTKDNAELLEKLPDWLALMKNAKVL